MFLGSRPSHVNFEKKNKKKERETERQEKWRKRNDERMQNVENGGK